MKLMIHQVLEVDELEQQTNKIKVGFEQNYNQVIYTIIPKFVWEFINQYYKLQLFITFHCTKIAQFLQITLLQFFPLNTLLI